ncbi:uncharacterized protein LOC105086820 isoform X2 [Camelus dromedarius]|uniref:Uncharacterized protein LOC116662781 isoform X2 n=1 Tax=Camelus ferus TaxID=419612 RepID=A0A8B8STC7_CAMFR|nr:uncharacterized protein LOC105086820 isoform X2 [Camelus dromedarius]XP_031529365.1 uncharacterized protein LOC116278402 isoform X2 [Vicugna pacos]XP_032333039.1 uncharacterized protein LOC116662781 isoform X2 [Camelus ferus]XP_032333042.1 uncharacterized protein LOC116662781 isoform X2 [Camelus ferus]XP_032333050.1 uncharacterized protein LOC116662781 isoform X2 [Camelus ferus]
MEIILELQQSAQPHNTEAGTQIDRQISQLVEGASGWQLWAIGCWTTIGKTEMEQGQKIAHFYATQPLLSHDLKEFYWDNCPNEVPSILSKCLQMHGWWCGSDGARVTSRLFSGPCKQSRPMTCSIVPFEEEASSVMMKKNQGVPLLTIGSSSRLQRGY